MLKIGQSPFTFFCFFTRRDKSLISNCVFHFSKFPKPDYLLWRFDVQHKGGAWTFELCLKNPFNWSISTTCFKYRITVAHLWQINSFCLMYTHTILKDTVPKHLHFDHFIVTARMMWHNWAFVKICQCFQQRLEMTLVENMTCILKPPPQTEHPEN